MKKLFLLSSALCLLSSFALADSQREHNIPGGKFDVHHVQVALSSAQIYGMYAAPVKLLDPVGAGRSIIISRVALTMTRTATSFANGGIAIVQYASTTHGGGTQALDSTIAATVITGAAGTTVTVRQGAIISDSAAVANAGVYISNATGAFDTGTGSAVVDVWYYEN